LRRPDRLLFLSYLPKKCNPPKPKAGKCGKEVNQMRKHVFEITDIFRGAFFLCNGGDLAGIKINGDRVATFLIRGEGLIKLDRDYRSGKALVNPLQFRESLNHLRDILFKTLREEERKRYDDRKRRDRGDQKRH
jgi:hypothetical protein